MVCACLGPFHHEQPQPELKGNPRSSDAMQLLNLALLMLAQLVLTDRAEQARII